jgi:alpha-beta hydrolase superfamily lysophospholipase
VTLQPHLQISEPEHPVSAVAVVLHGGRANGRTRVRPSQLAVLRMLPFARALSRAGARDGLAVARLRYAVRGWNGAEQSPVADARWALDQLAERFPGRPVALVGHSMGGRTAIYAAGHPNVACVVGLAPWLEAGDPVVRLAGRRVLIAHGTADRMTSPVASAEFARRAAPVATSVSYVQITGERHAMLRRPALWHELTAGFVTGCLLDRPPAGTDGGVAANILTKALAGEPLLVA